MGFKGYSWGRPIRVHIGKDELLHFDRDTRKAMTTVKKVNSFGLLTDLTHEIIEVARDYSPNEWYGSTGKLKKGIKYYFETREEVHVQTTAKKHGIPYGAIQEVGRDYVVSKDKKMKFPSKDGGSFVFTNIVSKIWPSRYMERAVHDVLTSDKNTTIITNEFDIWKAARDIRKTRVKKGKPVRPVKKGGPSETEIQKAPEKSLSEKKYEEYYGGAE